MFPSRTVSDIVNTVLRRSEMAPAEWGLVALATLSLNRQLSLIVSVTASAAVLPYVLMAPPSRPEGALQFCMVVRSSARAPLLIRLMPPAVVPPSSTVSTMVTLASDNTWKCLLEAAVSVLPLPWMRISQGLSISIALSNAKSWPMMIVPLGSLSLVIAVIAACSSPKFVTTASATASASMPSPTADWELEPL